MKKLFLSLCFASFLGAGLVSCTDEAAEITPDRNLESTQHTMQHDGDKPTATPTTRP